MQDFFEKEKGSTTLIQPGV